MIAAADHATVDGLMYYASASTGYRYCYAYDAPRGTAETNVEFVEKIVAVRDVRSVPQPLCLEVHGAAVVSHRTAVRSFSRDEEVRAIGYAEAEELVRAVTGAGKAIVFDHNIRRGGSGPAERQAAEPQRPVFHVHTDFTAKSAFARVTRVLGADWPRQKRFVAINVWRPIRGPVVDSPLAICDASSVADADLRKADLIYPDRTGEINYVAYNPAHRWYYVREMATDQVWIFKNFDSGGHGGAKFTPHTAFADRPPDLACAARESIEFRAFALFE
jgi:hypothetical protein